MFREGTQSAHDLVHQGRIDPRLMSFEAVKSVLGQDPELTEEWQRWSEERRTSSGWFFRYENGLHILGYYPRDKRVAFPDATSACAAFIIRELRSIW